MSDTKTIKSSSEFTTVVPCISGGPTGSWISLTMWCDVHWYELGKMVDHALFSLYGKHKEDAAKVKIGVALFSKDWSLCLPLQWITLEINKDLEVTRTEVQLHDEQDWLKGYCVEDALKDSIRLFTNLISEKKEKLGIK